MRETNSESTSTGGHIQALAEVCVAFVVMHVAFRSIKHFTSWGEWELPDWLRFAPWHAMVTEVPDA